MTTCIKCSSTATHYPRVYFSRGSNRMGILRDQPVCAEHRVPIPELYLNRHEFAVYAERFRLEYDEEVDATRTRVAFELATDPEVERWQKQLREVAKETRIEGQKRVPIILDTSLDEEEIAILESKVFS